MKVHGICININTILTTLHDNGGSDVMGSVADALLPTLLQTLCHVNDMNAPLCQSIHSCIEPYLSPWLYMYLSSINLKKLTKETHGNPSLEDGMCTSSVNHYAVGRIVTLVTKVLGDCESDIYK